jgi:hypothetical protein
LFSAAGKPKDGATIYTFSAIGVAEKSMPISGPSAVGLRLDKAEAAYRLLKSIQYNLL